MRKPLIEWHSLIIDLMVLENDYFETIYRLVCPFKQTDAINDVVCSIPRFKELDVDNVLIGEPREFRRHPFDASRTQACGSSPAGKRGKAGVE